MFRRLVPVGLAVLAAGCGSAGHTAAPATTAKPRPHLRHVAAHPHRAAPKAKQKPKPRTAKGEPRPAGKERPVVVVVVNGDTQRRVWGATVHIAGHAARTNRRGAASIRLRRHLRRVVVVIAPRFIRKAVVEPFQRKPIVRVRIFRRSLQWTMYGASAQRTQAQNAIKLRPPFHVVWSRGLGALIEFPAVVSDGVAYVANYRGTVFALRMDNGHLVWLHRTPAGKMAASPAVYGKTLIVHGMDGHVWVLNRRNGHLLWHYTVGSPVESSPVVHHNVDYFGAWNGVVYALDLRTHHARWTHYSGAKITSSAALSGNTVFIGDYGGRLLALSKRTGSLRWAGHVNGRIYGTPAVAGRRVFVPSSDGNSLTAFSTGGRMLWRINTGSMVYSSPAVWRGRVFFGAYNGVFYSASASSGRILWEVGMGGPISGAAAVVDGIAYAGSFSHRIYGVDARRGRVRLRFPHGEYVPVSGNGGTLLLHGYSRLYAVQPRRHRRHRR